LSGSTAAQDSRKSRTICRHVDSHESGVWRPSLIGLRLDFQVWRLAEPHDDAVRRVVLTEVAAGLQQLAGNWRRVRRGGKWRAVWKEKTK